MDSVPVPPTLPPPVPISSTLTPKLSVQKNDSEGPDEDLWTLFERSARILPDPLRDRAYIVWFNKSVRPQIQVRND